MSYTAQWKLLNDPGFRGRVTVASLHAAQDVLGENDVPAPDSPRKVFALQVQNQNPPAIDALVLACAMNPTVAAAEEEAPGSSADGDLDYVVAASWNRLAGA